MVVGYVYAHLYSDKRSKKMIVKELKVRSKSEVEEGGRGKTPPTTNEELFSDLYNIHLLSQILPPNKTSNGVIFNL